MAVYTNLVIYKLGATGFQSPDTEAIGAAREAVLSKNGREYTLTAEKIEWTVNLNKKRGLMKFKHKLTGYHDNLPSSINNTEVYFATAVSPAGSVCLRLKLANFNPFKAEFVVTEFSPNLTQVMRRDSVLSESAIDDLIGDLVGM
jgi:hypothetical protein